MSYAIRLPDQLKQHLRVLRKSHGLTQAQLGALIGVKQARIAEIEANPGAVSLDQLTRILAALGGTLHLHAAGKVAPSEPRIALPTPTAHPKAPAVRRKAATTAKSAQRTKVVIRSRKGVW